MSMCGEVGSDVDVFIKELAIRRVEHRFEIHSNESQHLAEGKEVGPLRQQLSFCFTEARTCIPHALSSLQTRSDTCGHTADPFGRLGVSVHAHCTKGATGSEGREGANGVGGRIGVGGGNGNGNGVGAGTGTRTVMGTRTEREQERGWRRANECKIETGTGAGMKTRAVEETGTGTRSGTGIFDV